MKVSSSNHIGSRFNSLNGKLASSTYLRIRSWLPIWWTSGYEAIVIILNGFGTKAFVIKIYKHSKATRWLSKVLRKHHGLKNCQNPIPHREFRILEQLAQFDIAPKPIAIKFNCLIMTYEGIPLSKLESSLLTSLQPQAREIYSALRASGVSHNDVKLNNLVVDDFGKLRILDFTFADTKELSIQSHKPNQNWGRFNQDNRLLDLITLS